MVDLEERVHAIEDAMGADTNETTGLPVWRVADRLKHPRKRSAAAIAKARRIVGTADGGPPDLAKNCRRYLHGEAE